MKYTPREPREGVNVSKEHPLVEAGTLIAGLGLILVAILVALVFLVELVLYFVPAEKEAQLFTSWRPDDLVTVASGDDRLEQVDSLLERLSRHWPESHYELRVEIHDSPAVNAVALPGGLVVVTTGLLDRVESENELAFVLGHELGHFRNRDHIRGLGRGLAFSLLFAALSATEGSATLGLSLADLTLRGFSRRQESAADRFGLGIVHREYGHLADAWRFFERIDRDTNEFAGMTGYLSTHPSPENRVRSIVEYAGENGWSVSGELTGLDW